MAEKISWGKNRGCSFLSPGCVESPSVPEFCNDQYLGCSSDTLSTTICTSTIFSNSCKMRMLNENCMNSNKSTQIFETVSPQSQCHYYKNSRGTTAACVKTECDYENMQYYLIKDDNQYSFKYLCEYKNQEHIIPNFGFTLLCEDPKLICSRKLDCPGNCNGRGICLENGKCHCYSIFEGDLCGRFIGCPDKGSSICQQILSADSMDTREMSNDYASALAEIKVAQGFLQSEYLCVYSFFYEFDGFYKF